jgi:hypothetical protein
MLRTAILHRLFLPEQTEDHLGDVGTWQPAILQNWQLQVYEMLWYEKRCQESKAVVRWQPILQVNGHFQDKATGYIFIGLRRLKCVSAKKYICEIGEAHNSSSRHTGGILRSSVKQRTSPQDTSPTGRVEKSCWTSLTWCRRLHNSVDNNNVLFLEARLKLASHVNARIVFDKQ